MLYGVSAAVAARRSRRSPVSHTRRAGPGLAALLLGELRMLVRRIVIAVRRFVRGPR